MPSALSAWPHSSLDDARVELRERHLHAVGLVDLLERAGDALALVAAAACRRSWPPCRSSRPRRSRSWPPSRPRPARAAVGAAAPPPPPPPPSGLSVPVPVLSAGRHSDSQGADACDLDQVTHGGRSFAGCLPASLARPRRRLSSALSSAFSAGFSAACHRRACASHPRGRAARRRGRGGWRCTGRCRTSPRSPGTCRARAAAAPPRTDARTR